MKKFLILFLVTVLLSSSVLGATTIGNDYINTTTLNDVEIINFTIANIGIYSSSTAKNFNIAIGRQVSVTGDGAISIGDGTNSGLNSIAIGKGAQANGNSVAIGNSANASATNSISLGSNTQNNIANSFKLGGDLTDAYFDGVSLNLLNFDSKGSDIIYVNNSDSKEFILDKDVNLNMSGYIISESLTADWVEANDGWIGVTSDGLGSFIDLSDTLDWSSGAEIGYDKGSLFITSDWGKTDYFVMDSSGDVSMSQNLDVSGTIDASNYSVGGVAPFTGVCDTGNFTVTNGIITACNT